MFGEKVIARSAAGKPIQARVWELGEEKIYICIDPVFEQIKELSWETFPPNKFPVAFPKADVFVFDADLFDALVLDARQRPKLWSKLTVYGN